MWRTAPLVMRLLAVSLVALALADPGPGDTALVSRRPERPTVRATVPPRRQGRKKRRTTTTTTTIEPEEEDEEHTTPPTTTTIDPRLFDHSK
ncbi:unnamed protein product [Leptosia nina]|uniref:Secreted protein n=1 Tax=Leptosia nina TaxID=320188 RepID=A0AAV1JZ38_9NEOP